jgi:hypothetical protein
MKMVGHKTEAIYRRYAIVDEAMMQSAAEKLVARPHWIGTDVAQGFSPAGGFFAALKRCATDD